MFNHKDSEQELQILELNNQIRNLRDLVRYQDSKIRAFEEYLTKNFGTIIETQPQSHQIFNPVDNRLDIMENICIPEVRLCGRIPLYQYEELKSILNH